MKYNLGLILLVLFASSLTLVSCSAKKAVLNQATTNNVLSANKIIENNINTKKDFKTLYLKADISYEDNKQSQNVSAEIKLNKDEKILISIRFIGITMAKAMITPTEVKYYEKINGKFFEGNFASLSKWLGTDLDFYKIQNMLIGQAMDDLKKGKYEVSTADNAYKLEEVSGGNIQKAFFFDSNNFLIKKQEINQIDKSRKFQIGYSNYKEFPEAMLPLSLLIETFQNDSKTEISIDYKNATFNEELSFPYNVPDGYERIIIID